MRFLVDKLFHSFDYPYIFSYISKMTVENGKKSSQNVIRNFIFGVKIFCLLETLKLRCNF